MSRSAVKIVVGCVLSVLSIGAAQAQTPPAWSPQQPSQCSDQYGAFDAFVPGMRGFGSCNRGGFVPNTNVIVVTNTNSSGAGSFAAAASAGCPKVILFGVAGRINQGDSVTMNDCDNWSIVGASAPGNVALTGSDGIQLGTRGDNWTIDHMVIAPGDQNGGTAGNRDAIGFGGPSAFSNAIVMNSLLVWGMDEVVQCYPSQPMTNVLYWQNIMGVNVNPSHNLTHIMHYNCTKNATIRSVYLHSNGRLPLVRADDYFHANNVTLNPGFQSVLLQPCDGTSPNRPEMLSHVVHNLMVRGPNTDGHAYVQAQGTSCLTGNGLRLYETGNSVETASSGAIQNCANHGCISGVASGAFQSSPVTEGWPTGYVPETFPKDAAGHLAFGQRVMAFAGPRPADRLPYVTALLGEVENALDQSGSIGGFATGTASEGGLAAITDSAPAYDPRDGAQNLCGESMPTGAAANAIQSSGLTRLHEWTIGCFYDAIMPGGYREDALENYPAPDGPTPEPPTTAAKPNPPSILQVF